MSRRSPARVLALVLALAAGGCGRSDAPPPPPEGVCHGPDQPALFRAAQAAPGVAYRMVDRADQLRAVLPHHNLPPGPGGAAPALADVVDALPFDQLTWERGDEPELAPAVPWSAPFPPPAFPRFTGRWIQAADHDSLLEVVVAGEVLTHAAAPRATEPGTWSWGRGRLRVVLPEGQGPPAGEVRLRYDGLGHDAWHADLHGGLDGAFLVRRVTLPARGLERSAPQLDLREPQDRREAIYVPAPGEVADALEIPAAARLELACGLVLQPTFELPDPVAFRGLFVDEHDRATELFRVELDPADPAQRAWHPVEVDLSGLAGQRGELRLRTEPAGDPRLALAAFAHPRIVASAPDAATRPSVLIVLVDTMRADAVGGDAPVAPRLRALADGALWWRDAVSTAPWTTPSVISLYSGLAPRAHHHNAKQIMRNGSPSLAAELRDAGYATFALQTNPALRDAGVDLGVEELLYLHDAQADRVTDGAAAWLAARADEPFFAYVHYMDPHGDYLPHPELSGWDGAPPPGLEPPHVLGRLAILDWDAGPEGHAWVARRYEEEVRFADHHLGRLLEAGDRDGWGARTVVVVVTDHGEELWDHGGFEHGHTFHRELLDVLLVVRLPPDLAAGVDPAATERPASLVDVRPTVLGLLGLPVAAPCQGLDLLGPAFPQDRTRIAEANLYGEPGFAAIQGPWRYLEQGGAAALYDLSRDPGEQADRRAEERTLAAVLDREVDVEHQLRCDSVRAMVDERSTDARDPLEVDLATRRALELLGYVEPGGTPPAP